MLKSKIITSILQSILTNKDIRYFKKSFFYYIFFRLIRKFLNNDLIIKIYNFKVYGSINKNSTSHFLLKKCEFGDYNEFNTIEKISKKNKIFLVDCGCNYGFYSFFTASLSERNFVVSIEASPKTSDDFLKNLNLNNFKNILFMNKAVSNEDNKDLHFNESLNDWESSLTHSNFNLKKITEIKSTKIDTILKSFDLKDASLFIKLDIEGHEMSAIEGGLKTIKEFSPIIIIEFSKFIFDNKANIDYLKDFLAKHDYKIYDTNKSETHLEEILMKLDQLTKNYKTIGNYFLIKNFSRLEKQFKSNE